MLSTISTTNENREKDIQNKLNSYIDSSNSSVFKSGAGAGKTYALVETLKYIINNYGSILSKHNQKILCITYTNVAADEMKERLGASQLVKISTIHERIWNLIREYKPQLVEIHKEKLHHELSIMEQKLNDHINFKAYQDLTGEQQKLFNQIMLKHRDDFYKVYNANAKEVEKVFNPILSDFPKILQNKDKFRKTVTTVYKIYDYKHCLDMIENHQSGYVEVIYNANYNSDRLHNMQISHDTLLEYGLHLIENYDLVKQLLIDQYPFILIDEYQDTNTNVIEIMSSLDKYASKLNRKFLVGYFGDPIQSIYEDGIGNHLQEIHSDLKTVKKSFNRRSCQEIIDVTNNIRMDEIIQESIYDNATGGSVKFYYGVEEDVDTFIQKHLDKWSEDKDNSINCFFLTHKTAAQYSGFSDIYEHLINTKKYKKAYNQVTTELLSNDPTKLGEVPRLLLNIVRFIKQIKSDDTPILDIYNNKQFYEEISLNELQNMIHLLKKLNGTTMGEYIASIEDIYKDSVNIKLQKLINEVIGFEKITYESFHDYLLQKLFPDLEENDYKNANQTVSKLLATAINSYENWYEYIQMRDKGKNALQHNKINYHTYHSTKGLEFDNVLIIMDNNFNRQKDFFKFYFKHYNNVEDLDNKEFEKFEKAKNLLYVACSRAVKNLRILYLDEISEVQGNLTQIFGEIERFNYSKETVQL